MEPDPPGAAAARAPPPSSSLVHLSAFRAIKPTVLLLVVLIAVDLVLFYRISIVMGRYVVVWSHILYPVLYTCANAPIFAIQWLRGKVTSETISYPVSRLATMAALDQAYQVLSAWPLPVLGGAVANVLSLLALPMNMTIAYYFLRRRYGWSHFAGVALCICASVVQVFPSMVDDEDGLGGSDAASGGIYFMWVFIMVLSALPNAASCVFKEAELKALAGLDVWYMNLVIGAWQVVFGLLSLPLVAFPGSPAHVPLLELPDFIRAGLACALGLSQGPGDLCASDVVPAIVVIGAFLAINTAFSSLSLVVFRDESSAVYGVASAASLGLVSVLLLFPLIAGPAVLQPSHLDAGAAALAVAGALMYQWLPEQTEDHGSGPAGGSEGSLSGRVAVPVPVGDSTADGVKPQAGHDGLVPAAGLPVAVEPVAAFASRPVAVAHPGGLGSVARSPPGASAPPGNRPLALAAVDATSSPGSPSPSHATASPVSIVVATLPRDDAMSIGPRLRLPTPS